MTFDFKKISQLCEKQPPFRLKQIYQAIFLNLITDWSQVTNLPKELLEQLQKKVTLEIESQLLVSKDEQSAKSSITLFDNNKIETVLMRHKGNRNTVCVSSQVGCALGCDFCATGQMGFVRNLEVDEILIQILFWQRILKKEDQRVTNVVFMGMGEPFLNYDNVIEAVRKINDKNYFNIAARHISVSTVGIVEGINKFAAENFQANLAISLHSADEDLRKKIMPSANKYSLDKILQAVNDYIEKTNRKVMIEYVLLRNINDSEKDAYKLAELLQEKLEKLYFVNLITYNATAKYQATEKRSLERFREILEQKKIVVVQRYRLGQDIQAACGQLAGKS